MQGNQEGVSPLSGEVRCESRVLLRSGNEWQDEPVSPFSLTLQLQCLLLEKLLGLFQVTFLEKQTNRIRISEGCMLRFRPCIPEMRLPGRCWWRSICTSWFSAYWPWFCKCPPAYRTVVCPSRASNPSDQIGQSSGRTAAAGQWSYLPADRTSQKWFHHSLHQSISWVKTNDLKGLHNIDLWTVLLLLLFLIALIIIIRVTKRRKEMLQKEKGDKGGWKEK